jgi:hypothetical protein
LLHYSRQQLPPTEISPLQGAHCLPQGRQALPECLRPLRRLCPRFSRLGSRHFTPPCQLPLLDFLLRFR